MMRGYVLLGLLKHVCWHCTHCGGRGPSAQVPREIDLADTVGEFDGSGGPLTSYSTGNRVENLTTRQESQNHRSLDYTAEPGNSVAGKNTVSVCDWGAEELRKTSHPGYCRCRLLRSR